MAALSKYSLFSFSVFLLGGGRFFIGGANRWGGTLLSVATAIPYLVVGRTLVIPRFKILAYEGFTSLRDAETTASTFSVDAN